MHNLKFCKRVTDLKLPSFCNPIVDEMYNDKSIFVVAIDTTDNVDAVTNVLELANYAYAQIQAIDVNFATGRVVAGIRHKMKDMGYRETSDMYDMVLVFMKEEVSGGE